MNSPSEDGTREVNCPYCGEAVATRVVYCCSCDTPHHEECFRESGVCCTYACGSTRYGRRRQQGASGALVLHELTLPSSEVEDFPFDVRLQAWADHHGGPIGMLMFTSLAFPGLLAMAQDSLGLSPWFTKGLASGSLLLFAGLLGLPFFLFVMQHLVKKSYRYSEKRNRLEVAWRFPFGFTLCLGLLQGKKITGLSLEGTGDRRAAFTGRLNCYRASFHRKGKAPFFLPMVTLAGREVVDRQVTRLRELVSAPFVADPSGILMKWLGENALWAMTVAIEISAGLILQIPFWAVLFGFFYLL